MISETEILLRVQTVIMRTLKNAAFQTPISRETTAHHVQGWDSLSHAVLIMAVEREFAIELPLEDTLDMTNVGELVDMVSGLTNDPH